jgi:plastocyanin
MATSTKHSRTALYRGLAGTAIASIALLGTMFVARAGEKHLVSQKGKTFSSSELSVKVGDVVTFQNDDEVAHNAFSASKTQPFNTKIQTPGSTADITFTTEGTVEIRCAIHPSMKMTIHVTK